MSVSYIDDGTAIAGDHMLARDSDGWWGIDLAEAGRLGDPDGGLSGDAWWAQAAWVRGQTLGSTPQEAADRLERLLAQAGVSASGPADDEPDILDAPAGAVAAILTGIGTLAGLSVREAVREVIWFAGLIT